MHPSVIIFYLRTQSPSCHQRILPTYENSLGVLRSPKMGSGFRGCGVGTTTSWCFIIHASLRYMSPVNPRSCGFPRRILPSRMRSFAMRRPHFMRRSNELPRWALRRIYERSSPRSGGKGVSYGARYHRARVCFGDAYSREREREREREKEREKSAGMWLHVIETKACA